MISYCSVAGTTAAKSNGIFLDWVDSLVTSVSSEKCKVYTIPGLRDRGNFKNLSGEEFTEVLTKFSKLEQWAADIYANNLTCGAFLIMRWREGAYKSTGDTA